jgi:selenocysteine lyase/cysteine desulfurase
MDLQRIREQEFPLTKEWCFFTHAATAPLSKRAATAMEKQIWEHRALGSVGHEIWDTEQQQTRALVARLINADPGEVAFIRNTAEGISFVIQGLGAFPVDVRQAHIDVLACGGQKWMLGPRGCGICYCSQRVMEQIRVTVIGASSVIDDENYLDYHLSLKPEASRFEYGTPNTVGIAGLRGAIELFLIDALLEALP